MPTPSASQRFLALTLLAAFLGWMLMAWFDKSYAKAGATISLIYLCGMLLIRFAPETRGRPLPE